MNGDAKRIAVFGAGGVGGYFGGRLAAAGHDVTFIARGAHLDSLRESGLSIESPNGDFLVDPAQATDDPAEVGTVDAVLVCVKTWQVPGAAEAMRPMVGPETLVLPLENGVEAPDQLAEVLGGERVLGGLCGIVAFLAGPGRVRHAAFDPFIQLGELDNRRTPRVEALAQALDRADSMAVQIADDIHVALWRKLTFIAPTSGVGAVTRAPMGVTREVPETRELLRRAMQEVVDVGRARGVALPAGSVEATMAVVDGMAPEATASMQRDLMAGRPSELEAQNGAVVRLGREAGVATPVNEYLYGSLLPMERRARGELRFEG